MRHAPVQDGAPLGVPTPRNTQRLKSSTFGTQNTVSGKMGEIQAKMLKRCQHFARS
jgi:hypothetical protein